jgi:L-iditol 2-dehydrogenase
LASAVPTCTTTFTIGHEFAGVVEALGEGVTAPAVGTRVAVEPGMNCGRCEWCERGLPNQCPHVRFYGTPPVTGAFAEYVVHPARLLFPVPDSLTDEDAAVLEPLGVAIHVIRRTGVDLGDDVAVFGCGPVGLLTVQCARAAGASRVFATDIVACRREFAGRMGAADTASPLDTDVVRWLAEATGGRGPDACIECAGEQSTLDECVRAVRVGGRVSVVGIPSFDRFAYDAHVARRKELDIRNVRRSRFAVEAGLAMAASGQVDLRSIVTHRFALDEVGRALELVHEKADGVVKAVVRVS